MQRIHDGMPRQSWEAHLESLGFVYNNTTDVAGSRTSYWREGPYYTITSQEQQLLERVATSLFKMCIEAGDHMIANPDIMHRMGIPSRAFPSIIKSWEEEWPSVYGRFDLRYSGDCPQSATDPSLLVPKLFEFNADTPTSLFEAAYVQWDWYNHTSRAGDDQWNSIHEALVRGWRRQIELHERRTGQRITTVHFAHTAEDTSGEDLINTAYLADTAREAGYEVVVFFIEQLQKYVDESGRLLHYLDPFGKKIDLLFKLYPWEWMWNVEPSPVQHHDTNWIEPPYKMLWSNKGLLAVLWKLFGNDSELGQYLLPAYFTDEPRPLADYVHKPLLGREGANTTIRQADQIIAESGGNYGNEGYIAQEFAPLPNFRSPFSGEDHHAVLGVWMVDGEPAGMGVRESSGLITDNTSCFVPHIIRS